jgi:hypothetical protein
MITSFTEHIELIDIAILLGEEQVGADRHLRVQSANVAQERDGRRLRDGSRHTEFVRRRVVDGGIEGLQGLTGFYAALPVPVCRWLSRFIGIAWAFDSREDLMLVEGQRENAGMCMLVRVRRPIDPIMRAAPSLIGIVIQVGV